MKKKILVVDKDENFVAELGEYLSEQGYEVVTADGQVAAEEVLKNAKVDLVVTALMMEHTDSGFVLCYHIKKQTPEMPIILVTGVRKETGVKLEVETPQAKAWIKADVMLPKPVRSEQLKFEIDKLLAI